MQRHQVFLSYSRLDVAELARVSTQLRAADSTLELDIWSDERIGAGEVWLSELAAAIDRCSAAVLLVSDNWLGSDFVRRTEIPALLQARFERNAQLMPFLLRDCPWEEHSWISARQLRPIGRALAHLPVADQDAAIASFASEVLKVQRPATTGQTYPNYVLPISVDIARLPIGASRLFGRERELRLLDSWWSTPTIDVGSIVAEGGTGKTALVQAWVARMREQNYRGASRVLAWSFHNQEARTGGADATDVFVMHALGEFGIESKGASSAAARAKLLTTFLKSERVLLILDGVETLQAAPGPDGGDISDLALARLIRSLAAGQPGLCIVTTRHAVRTLVDREQSSAPRLNLEGLDSRDALLLLKELGAVGTDAGLATVARRLHNHCLLLNLFGSFVRDFCEGDIRKAPDLPPTRYSDVGHLVDETVARYVLALQEGSEDDRADLAVLDILGLFDRPADFDLIAAIAMRATSNDSLGALKSLLDRRSAWQAALLRLRARRLVLAGTDKEIDTHPLVRGYFGANFENRDPEGARSAHSYIFEELCKLAPDLPTSLSEMEPLLQAVRHGVKSGRTGETLSEVFIRRMGHGDSYFISKQLGANGAQLESLRAFFVDARFHEPLPTLDGAARSWLLGEAGYGLMALGRLRDAKSAFLAGRSHAESAGDWRVASVAAQNLVDLLMATGPLQEASTVAGTAIAFGAVESGSTGPESVEYRNSIALRGAVYHMSGRLADAERDFRTAEELQCRYSPTLPRLRSLRGFWYTRFLLDTGRTAEAVQRSEEALRESVARKWVRSIARDRLALAMSLGDSAGARALDEANLAVDGMWQGGNLLYVPEAMIARATLLRLKGDYAGAARDLSEARQLSADMGAIVTEVDARLELARLDIEQQSYVSASEHLRSAEVMLKGSGYHRRAIDLLVTEGRLAFHLSDKNRASECHREASKRAKALGYRAVDRELALLHRQLNRV